MAQVAAEEGMARLGVSVRLFHFGKRRALFSPHSPAIRARKGKHMTFLNEDYEAICVAIAMIDGAVSSLEYNQICEDEVSELHHMRNGLNELRILLLGGGSGKPYHVSGLSLKENT